MSADEETWESCLDLVRERRNVPGSVLCGLQDLRDMEDDDCGAVLLVLGRIIVQARLEPRAPA